VIRFLIKKESVIFTELTIISENVGEMSYVAGWGVLIEPKVGNVVGDNRGQAVPFS